jgi:hypothetical protein
MTPCSVTLLPLYPASVIPRVPLGSRVTSGEFCKPTPVSSVVTSLPVRPSRMYAPDVVGTMMSW